jgi:RimJ/RimL family protein N-acetyltransferase
VVSDLETPRLRLHAVDEPEARRIAARAPEPADGWAADYPFVGDLAAIDGFLRATEQHGAQQPFGYYQIIRASDALAIGGAGFKGFPRDGSVEVGYGLAPSARGHGYAAEAVTALLAVAVKHGVATVLADSADENVASQRTLVRAGFSLVGSDAGLQRYQYQAEHSDPATDDPATDDPATDDPATDDPATDMEAP